MSRAGPWCVPPIKHRNTFFNFSFSDFIFWLEAVSLVYNNAKAHLFSGKLIIFILEVDS